MELSATRRAWRTRVLTGFERYQVEAITEVWDVLETYREQLEETEHAMRQPYATIVTEEMYQGMADFIIELSDVLITRNDLQNLLFRKVFQKLGIDGVKKLIAGEEIAQALEAEKNDLGDLEDHPF